MALIPIDQHPHNLDPTAAIVWERRDPAEMVFRVSAGFVAVARGRAFPATFASKDEAVSAIAALA